MTETVTAEGEATPAPEQETSPGSVLGEERRRQGLSVADVARSLKLAPRQIEALEADDYGALPGAMFVRGFTRNYAKLLGLDAEALVAGTDKRISPASLLPGAPRPSVNVPVPEMDSDARRMASRNDRGGRPFVVAALLGAVVIALVVGYVARAPRDASVQAPAPSAGGPRDVSQEVELTVQPETPVTAPATPATPATAGAGAPATATPQPAPAESSPSGGASEQAPVSQPAATPASGRAEQEIRMTFSRESWVEVRDRRGKVIFSQLNPEGSEQVVRGRPPLSVVVGNVSGVTLVHEGKPVDLSPYARTEVARLTLE